MKNITYETSDEKELIIGLQHSVGAKEDASIGNQTLIQIATKLCPDIFPLAVKMYGQPVLVGKDILAFDPNGSLKNYNNTISGSFTYIAGETPCSIMINGGKDIWSSASKAWAGFKESVICKYKDGSIKLFKVKNTSEIPDRANVVVAVGGMGLLDAYNPYAEGFRSFTFEGKTFNHGDVLRNTNHTILGVKDGWFYGLYCANMNASEINQFCYQNMKFDMAILLDGGHIAAINTDDIDININQKQGYGIQFIKIKKG